MGFQSYEYVFALTLISNEPLSSAYKIRIDTSKTVNNSNIYIRDEKKDLMPYMSVSGILMILMKEVLDDLDAMDKDEEDDDDDEVQHSDAMSE